MKVLVSEVFIKAAAAWPCDSHDQKSCEICIEEVAKQLGFETWNGEMDAEISIEEAISIVNEKHSQEAL